MVLDSFQVDGPHGTHKCLVYQPLGMSFTEFRNLLPQKRFEKRMLQHSMQLLCIALDYLHKNKVVHTGKLALLGPKDDASVACLADN